MTTGRAFVLGDETVYREWGSVAMSRGTEENRPYVVAGERERDEFGDGRAPGVERDPVSEATRALAASRAKAPAIEHEAPEWVRSTLGDRPLAPRSGSAGNTPCGPCRSTASATASTTRRRRSAAGRRRGRNAPTTTSPHASSRRRSGTSRHWSAGSSCVRRRGCG